MRTSRRTPISRSTSRTISRSIRRRRRHIVRRTLLVGGMVVIAAQGKAAAMNLSQKDVITQIEHLAY